LENEEIQLFPERVLSSSHDSQFYYLKQIYVFPFWFCHISTG